MRNFYTMKKNLFPIMVLKKLGAHTERNEMGPYLTTYKNLF